MTTTMRKFGIEFEAHGLQLQAAAAVIAAEGIAVEVPSGHGNTSVNARGAWKVEYDGSLDYNGFEAVTPPSTSFDDVRKVCRALTRAGCYVNRRCGTHVHVDARDLGLDGFKRLAKIWLSVESAFDRLVSASRRANNFCRPSVARFSGTYATWAPAIDACPTVDHVIAKMQVDRYAKLNLSAFKKHGTVEFRTHGGTLNAAKIERWARLVVRLVDLAAKPDAWRAEVRPLGLEEALAEIFRVRDWNVAGAAAPVAAPAFAPREGSKRAELWAIFNANPDASASAAATIAETAGFMRKYATDQHWHWRRARAIAAPVAGHQVLRDEPEEMADAISFFKERAEELSAA